MIELAPGHKQGFVVKLPVVVAGGIVGYGEAAPRGLALEKAGAVVVGPLMAQSRNGANLPRIAETMGGLVLETGLQNRGLSSALGKFARLWPRLGCPVVAQVAEAEPRGLARVIERLAGAPGLACIELLPLTTELETAQQMVRAAARIADLPVWVKLALSTAVVWGPALVQAGASGLVVGQPPVGALSRGAAPGQVRGTGALVRGGLYGPLAFAPMLDRLAALAELHLPCALIACGGIHSVEQARQALAVGAQAVQLDTALWVEPALLGWLVDELAADEQASG
ncbi:MAG TPA: hypothetical protein VNK95_01450 [Caldilineaceae bacterium]|nr:hypothetical protein [Caldilineaceae bacterium]